MSLTRGEMSRISAFVRSLTLAGLLVQAMMAGESGWDNRLAENYSKRWTELQQDLSGLASQLTTLPEIPLDDQGGTGGYASNYTTPTPAKNSSFAVEVRWSAAATVDLVALIPARRYDAKGLDAQYGLPHTFRVDLINAKGEVVCEVAREASTSDDPVRRGHPFVYQVSPPVTAVGLRISAERLNPNPEEAGLFVHAWAEAMVFEGSRNLALAAEVTSVAGVTPPAPWHWNPSFLVDGETPLGLPEMPVATHHNIGWMSEGRASALEAASLDVNLGTPCSFDSIRLIPAKRPTSDLSSGFGFPRKLVVSVSDSGEAGKWSVVAERDSGNPGHNPVVVTFPSVSARHIKVEATQLWKAYDQYPAFFALSEFEILAGDLNLALGKGVHSPDGMANLIASGGRFWSSAALTDGFGPDGQLLPIRNWIQQLDQRLQLETHRHHLQMEASQVVDRWRHTAQIGFALLAFVGAFLTIALPIRYRLHASRELKKVRERIAGDLHDEVGSNLGSIQMFADLAEGRSGSSDELKRIQRIAAETVSAVRDIVWLLRPTGDHRIATVEHLRETSSIMLEALKWKFTANEAAWDVELPEESNRHLFLYFREALHNILRHAKAATVKVHAEKTAGNFLLTITDDGVGISPTRLEKPATLRALRQRAAAMGAELRVESEPDQGTRLILSVTVEPRKKPGIRPFKAALSDHLGLR
jgi:signal transduction histidine kinase